MGGKVTVPAGKAGGKGQQSKGGETKKPVQTKEDLMARKIQTAYRGYRFAVLSWKQVFGTGWLKKKAHF